MKSLVLNITNKCNFMCKTCLRRYGRSEDLSLELLNKVIPEAMKLGLERVGITGGEPCLHPQFERLIKLLSENGIIFRFLTNGSLMHKYNFVIEDYNDYLFNCAISLDGATKKIHESIRQDGSYNKVIEAIKFSVSKRINTTVQTCLCSTNMHQIEMITELSQKLGANAVSFIGIIKTPSNKNLWLDDMKKKKIINKINIIKKKSKINIYSGQSLKVSDNIVFCDKLRTLSDISINPKGQLVFCCDTINDGAVIGSLYQKSLAQLYKEAFDWSSYLCKQRVNMISLGKKISKFNSCDFCNKMLKDRIN